MERLLINKDNIASLPLVSEVYLDTNSFNNEEMTIKANQVIDILIDDLSDDTNLKINMQKDSKAHIAILSKNTLKHFEITANLEENAEIEVFFADFSNGQSHNKVLINLNKNNAKAFWSLASLTNGKDNKEFEVSILHNSINTIARSDNYGVCLEEGKLVFSGISSIKKGSIKSKTRQNAKIMVFDETANGITRPILKIDENDIEAGHGAVVGKISDDHLFYLTSRGLTTLEAKKLITYGYLKPIMNGFKEERMKEEISSLVEKRV